MLDSIIIHYQYAGIKWLLLSSSESLEVKRRIVWKEESLKGNTAFVITGEFPWLSVGKKGLERWLMTQLVKCWPYKHEFDAQYTHENLVWWCVLIIPVLVILLESWGLLALPDSLLCRTQVQVKDPSQNTIWGVPDEGHPRLSFSFYVHLKTHEYVNASTHSHTSTLNH